jgi:hypothetical protein
MGERFAESDAKVEHRLAELEVRLERRFAAIDARFSEFEARLFRWFVGLLSTTLLSVVGVVVAVAMRR